MNSLEKIKQITERCLSIKELSAKSRERNNVYARSIYYKVCKEYTPYTLEEIAIVVGRDHSTVVHGLQKFESYIRHDPKFKKHYELIRESFIPIHDLIDHVDEDFRELSIKFIVLQKEYKKLLVKQRVDRFKLVSFLRSEKTHIKFVDISKDLNSTQVEQMFERMEQFAKMCNYHNQKKKVL